LEITYPILQRSAIVSATIANGFELVVLLDEKDIEALPQRYLFHPVERCID